ncbi:MAG: hypothetical protein ACI8WB_000531 [Phenylobacterium sp.]|jgi:hypothetical protein
MSNIKLIKVVLIILFIPSCGNSKTTSDCVARGISYFKEIGSYPKLSAAPNKGRYAKDVAEERCSRSTAAFPDI